MPISNLLTRKHAKEIMIVNFFRVMGGFVICFSFEASNFEINGTLSNKKLVDDRMGIYQK